MGLVRKRKSKAPPAPVVTIEGEQARTELPEGASASLPLADLVAQLVPVGPDSRGAVLPDGVKLLRALDRGGCIVVHQTPPRVHQFRWIAPDSPSDFGPRTNYRTVRLALPYLVVFAVFERGRGGMPWLSQRNECFFATQPLDREGLATGLCYPALLNCSRFPPGPANPLSWICTQHLSGSARGRRQSIDASLRAGLSGLLHHLLESGFNRSSERHELNSWFTETVNAAIDPRIASVETWEKASAEDPLFVLEVPWLPTGETLGSLTERIASLFAAPGPVGAARLASIIINHQSRSDA